MTEDPRKTPAYVALFRAEQAMAAARAVAKLSGADEAALYALVVADRARGIDPTTTASSHAEAVERMAQDCLLALGYSGDESLSRQVYACLVAAQKLAMAGLDFPPDGALDYLHGALRKLRTNDLSQN